MTVNTASQTGRICLGVIVGAQGIRGEVRIKTFTADPLDVSAYGALCDADDRRTFEILSRRLAGGVVVARLAGVSDRNAAETLKGTALFVSRDRLPPPGEDEFYHADLVGLAAATPEGVPLGTVSAVFDHGAGDVLEIAAADGDTLSVPFTRAFVPVVDVAGGRIVVAPPVPVEEDEGGDGP